MSRTPAPVNRRRFQRRLLFAVAPLAVVLSGCSSKDIPTMLGIPNPATKQAQITHNLWQGSWVALWAVGALVWGLIIWSVIAYRKRSDALPKQTRYNIPIELMYTIVPIMIVGVMLVFTIRDESTITKLSANPDVTVNVVGFRWSWTFNYVDENVYDVGSPTQLPTLYLPEGETVRFKLDSPDVIHSFWVPAFLMKMDVIPGRTNQFEVTPTKQGEFAGKCAELCGVDHSRMLFNVKVVSPQDYQAHIEALRAAGQTGQLITGRIDTNASGDKQGRTTIGGNQ